MPELIIHPQDNESVTMTIRIPLSLQKGYDAVAKQSGVSRNELIRKAMEYALQNMRIEKN